MNDRTEMSPEKPGELSEYQRQIKAVLDRIAAWKPRPVHVVSETAMTVAMTRDAGDFKRNRDLVHACFEIMQDRGFVIRESGCWRFTRAFLQEHADELSMWDGLFMPGPDLGRRVGR